MIVIEVLLSSSVEGILKFVYNVSPSNAGLNIETLFT